MNVKHGRLVLPDGMSYRMLVLPKVGTMTPRLLRKIKELVADGATIVGARPLKSPSLSDYPRCDQEVKKMADEMWGTDEAPAQVTERPFGKGKIIWGGEFRLSPEVAQQATNNLGSAKWIWNHEGNPAQAAPPGARYFRRLFTTDSSSAIASAQLEMTADNSFRCWVNGRSTASGDDYHQVYSLDLAPFLKPGQNLLAVEAVNGGDTPNPAGLIGLLSIKYSDGHSQEIPTDQSWQAARSVDAQWKTAVAPSDGWAAAMDLGDFGMAPWGFPGMGLGDADSTPDINPVCQLLARMGVPPDFSFQAADSSKCLRFIHRVTSGADIYFVANKNASTEQVLCSFRVQGRPPQLWWPDSGRIEAVAAYDQQNGSIRVPIHFDPTGSVFVVFPKRAAAFDPVVSFTRDGQSVAEPAAQVLCDADGHLSIEASQPGRYELKRAAGAVLHADVAAVPPPLQISGPWQLSFPPKWGAPDHVTLDKLISWSDHPDAGIKYFSGTATYSKSIEVPAALLDGNCRLYLDLGKVAVMARVKLNGQDLGILWKAPYRVEATGILHAGDNTLEVQVVNLWINRLIGDEHLPEDSDRNPDGTLKSWPKWLEQSQPSPTGRFTFTSWRLWKKDDPLVDSGLLGPVTLTAARQVPISPD